MTTPHRIATVVAVRRPKTIYHNQALDINSTVLFGETIKYQALYEFTRQHQNSINQTRANLLSTNECDDSEISDYADNTSAKTVTEARIILPQYYNDGRLITRLHAAVEQALIHYWGGYTKTEGVGAEDTGIFVYEEPVKIYDIAAIWTNSNQKRLIAIAAKFSVDSSQRSTYARFANAVQFVTPQCI